MTYCSVWHFGDVVRQVPAEATAFGDRSQPWLFSIDGIWSRTKDDTPNIAWVRRLWSTVRPYSNGRLYLNFLASSEGEATVVKEAIGADTYQRLREVKMKYDPTNFFRMNQNIPPA